MSQPALRRAPAVGGRRPRAVTYLGIRRRAAAGLVAGGLAIGLAAGPAWGADRIDRVVAGWGRSPLFVDPDVGSLLPPAERPAVEEAIRTAGIPLYVVVIPVIPDDESQGSSWNLLQTLRDRLGQPGVYLVVDEQGDIDSETFVARDVDLPESVRRSPYDQPVALGPRLLAAVDLIRQSPAGRAANPVNNYPADPLVRRNRSSSVPAGDLLRNAAAGFFIAGPFVGVLLYGVVGVTVLVARGFRRGRGAPAAGTLGPPLRTPDAPAEPTLRWLRRQATDELTALNEALDASAPSAPAGRPGGSAASKRRAADQRADALAAYDAAALLLGGGGGDQEDPLALVGAVVLARDGRRILFRPSKSILSMPCAVNPLHGPASKRVAVSMLGAPGTPRPLCPRCLALPAAARDAEVLHVEVAGELAPYFSFPGFWQDCGFDTTGPVLARRVREHLGVH